MLHFIPLDLDASNELELCLTMVGNFEKLPVMFVVVFLLLFLFLFLFCCCCFLFLIFLCSGLWSTAFSVVTDSLTVTGDATFQLLVFLSLGVKH